MPSEPKLTRRQLEVSILSARGFNWREAAAQLGISPKTVENHKFLAFDKLGIHRLVQLPVALLKAGLCTLEDL